MIADLETEAVLCEDGSFYVSIDFEYINEVSTDFSVSINEMLYGPFSYEDFSQLGNQLVGPLENEIGTTYEITVFDTESPSCLGMYNKKKTPSIRMLCQQVFITLQLKQRKDHIFLNTF